LMEHLESSMNQSTYLQNWEKTFSETLIPTAVKKEKQRSQARTFEHKKNAESKKELEADFQIYTIKQKWLKMRAKRLQQSCYKLARYVLMIIQKLANSNQPLNKNA
jgi:hypothetical protein